MIEIEVSQFFLAFLYVSLILLIIWWIRSDISFGKGWRISEDQIIHCRKCDCNFLTSTATHTVKCPRCKASFKNRWYRK
ncbi:MAG: hypothetical protein ACRC37_07760 [Lentisphaeria bacterium]